MTLEVEEGQDITAPLNTLFLELKDQATDENPCKIIIPPGNYELTGTLCMYSNMYLYARDANITKTSTTKHLILRLGNTKDSEGGYDGYRNIVIDGGTWDYNYQCVENKDAPGGFVGFCIGHATNVTIKNATFLNNLKSHFLEFGGVKMPRSQAVHSVAIIRIMWKADRNVFRSTAVQMRAMFSAVQTL